MTPTEKDAMALAKKCKVCGLLHPRDSYHSHSATCPGCRSEQDRGRRRSSRNPSRERTNAARERKSRWQKENADPTKSRARIAVRRALESGRLVAPTACQACGASPVRSDGRRGVQAHHHAGYDRPLDVMWLCPRCHRAHDDAARGGE